MRTRLTQLLVITCYNGINLPLKCCDIAESHVVKGNLHTSMQLASMHGPERQYKSRLARHALHIKVPWSEPEDLPDDFMQKVCGAQVLH